MDDGRPITVAVIGPADLTAEVSDIAEVAGVGRLFDGLEVWALPYERVDQAAELYARACGGAGSDGAGLAGGGAGSDSVGSAGGGAGTDSAGSAGPADAVLFTGPLGYRRGTRGLPVAAVPTVYVPYSPLWLYAPLFAVTDRDSLRRVSLDSLDLGVLETTYRELGLSPEAVAVYEPARDDPSPEEVAAFHRWAMEEGRSTCALTCVLSVYRVLRAAGVPCLWLVPSRVALAETLEKLLYVAEGVRARGARIVVGLVRPRDNGHPSNAARLRLRAHELLLSQVEEFDGHLIDAGSGDFQFFTTRAHFEKATDLYSHWPLREKLVRAGLPMSAGVGLGATAGEAGANAKLALDEAIRGGDGACYVMLEGRRLIGPLGPGAPGDRAGALEDGPWAREQGPGSMGHGRRPPRHAAGPASLPRTLAVLDRMGGDFTARDLALRLRVGLRTAHRLLLRLREAGSVVEVGRESSGPRGRPRRVFRRRVSGPDGAGGAEVHGGAEGQGGGEHA
jgi:hypothetical protein